MKKIIYKKFKFLLITPILFSAFLLQPVYAQEYFAPGYSDYGMGSIGFTPGYSDYGLEPVGFAPGYADYGLEPIGFTPGYSDFGLDPIGFTPGFSDTGLEPVGFTAGFSDIGLEPITPFPAIVSGFPLGEIFPGIGFSDISLTDITPGTGSQNISLNPISITPGSPIGPISPIGPTPGSQNISINPVTPGTGFSSLFLSSVSPSPGYSTLAFAPLGPSVAYAQVPPTGLSDDSRIIYFFISIFGTSAVLAYGTLKLLLKKATAKMAFGELPPVNLSILFEKAIQNAHILLFSISHEYRWREKLRKELQELNAITSKKDVDYEILKNQVVILREVWLAPALDNFCEKRKLRELRELFFELQLTLEGINDSVGSQELEMAAA